MKLIGRTFTLWLTASLIATGIACVVYGPRAAGDHLSSLYMGCWALALATTLTAAYGARRRDARN